MSDYIRREDAINCIERMTWYHVNGRGQLVDGATSDTGLYKAKDVYKGLYDIPSADVVQVETLKAEIYKLKCQQDSKNQDYYTGYMSALSTVEGIIAEMGEE